MASNSGRGWPLSIIGIFIFLGFMLFGILYISLRYVPVNQENRYQMGYQEVDKCFNEICEAQEQFDQKYEVDFLLKKRSNAPVETMRVNGTKAYFDHVFSLEEGNTVSLEVTDKAGNAVDDATITLLLTRYETGKYDKQMPLTHTGAGRYGTDRFPIEHPGRWKLVAKVEVGEDVGYFERGVFAR